MGDGVSDEAVTFRPYRPGDERQINEAFNAVFGVHRSLDEWAWKFPEVPGGRPIMLAYAGAKLLAQYAGLPTRFWVDGREHPAVQIVDLFSTREARRRFLRRGIFVKTGEQFFEVYARSGRYPLLFGFPGRRSLRIGVLQLGYDAMPAQEIFYLRRERGAGKPGVHRLGYRAELITAGDARLDALWERVRGDYPIAVVRDAQRAAHRLGGHPRVEYACFLILRRWGREGLGFVAFRTDGGSCRWVDLLWDHAHPGALELAAHLGLELAVQTGAAAEELWLNGDEAGAVRLQALGFQHQREPSLPVMVARSFDPALDINALHGRVYITMADADLV